MTDLGCFVITEGHVSCSAVIITNYSIQLFFSGFCEFAFFFATQHNVRRNTRQATAGPGGLGRGAVAGAMR